MKEHSIKIETNITTDDITNLLSMEGGGFDYWAEICYNEEDPRYTCIGLADVLEHCWQAGKLPSEVPAPWAMEPHRITFEE